MSTYQLLPPLSTDDLDRLKASIAERGVEMPVLVDEDGAIIDGHHRAMVADSLGIEYPRDVRRGLTDAEKRLLAVELNVARRQMTDAQKVMFGRRIEPEVRAEVRERWLASVRQGPNRPRSTPSSDGVDRGTSSDGRVAKATGLGEATYRRHKKVLALAETEAPDLLPYVENGDLTMEDLKREMESRGVAVPRERRVVSKPREPDAAPTAQAAPARPALAAVANVPPEARRVVNHVHDSVQRVRLLRSRYGAGRLALGVEGDIFARELEALRDEIDGFVDELRGAAAKRA